MTFKMWLAQYVIDPKGRYKILWDTFIGFLYVTCYILDPLVYAFDLQPFQSLWILEIIRA